MARSHLVCIGFLDGSVEVIDLNFFTQIPIKFEHIEDEVMLPKHDEGHTTAVCFRHYTKKFEGILRGMRIPDQSDEQQTLLIISGSSTGHMNMWRGSDKEAAEGPTLLKHWQHSLDQRAAITNIEVITQNKQPANCVVCDQIGQVRVYDMDFEKVLRIDALASPSAIMVHDSWIWRLPFFNPFDRIEFERYQVTEPEASQEQPFLQHRLSIPGTQINNNDYIMVNEEYAELNSFRQPVHHRAATNLSVNTLLSQEKTTGWGSAGKPTRPPSASAAPRASTQNHILQSIQNVRERRAYRESREQRIDRTRYEVSNALESRESMLAENVRKTKERQEEEAAMIINQPSTMTFRYGRRDSRQQLSKVRPLSAKLPPKLERASQSQPFLPQLAQRASHASGVQASQGTATKLSGGLLTRKSTRPSSGIPLPPGVKLRPPSRFMKRH